MWSSAASYIGDVGAAVVTVWRGCVSGLSLVPFRNIQGRQARSVRGSVELRRGPGAGPVGVRRGTEGWRATTPTSGSFHSAPGTSMRSRASCSTRPQTRRAARSAPASGARIEAEHMGNSSRRERNGVSNTQGVAGNFRH